MTDYIGITVIQGTFCRFVFPPHELNPCFFSNSSIESVVYPLWQVVCSQSYPDRLRGFNRCVRQEFLRHFPDCWAHENPHISHPCLARGVSPTAHRSRVDHIYPFSLHAKRSLRCDHVAVPSPTPKGVALTSFDPPRSRVRFILDSVSFKSLMIFDL